VVTSSTAAASSAASSTSEIVDPSVDVSTNIVVWAPGEEEAVIQTVVDDFNATRTLATQKFNYTFKSVSEADGGSTLGTDPTVTGYPSLIAIADDQVNNLVGKGIINPLDNYFVNDITAEDTSFALTCATNGGQVYGFPITCDNGYFLWYDGAQVTTAQASSLELLLAQAKTLGKHVLMDIPNGWYSSSFFFAQGVCGTDSLSFATTTTDGTSTTSYNINWDNAAGVAAATYLNTLLQPYYADGTLINGSNDPITAGFTDGSLIAAVSGTWMESALKPVCAGLAAKDLPSFTTADSVAHHLGSFAGSKLYVVNGYASIGEQTAALMLGKLLTSESAQLVRFTDRTSIPCNKAALLDPTYTANQTLGGTALAAQSNYAGVQSTSAESRYWPVGQVIGQAIEDGQLPEATPTWQTFLTAECDSLRLAA
jgi:arabinogalactan oligomer/maltooligosaccharide transport system substrate-binding protein